MNQPGATSSDVPFHRGNYKLRYTPEEHDHVVNFVSKWFPTKGLLSAVLGGGTVYTLMQTGIIGSRYKGIRIIGGGLLTFSIARMSAMRGVHKELREKYPEGYSAQMYYLSSHTEAFQDFIAYGREQQQMGRINRFQTMTQPTMPYGAPVGGNQPPSSGPAPEASDVPGSRAPPKGLDDRFRPQMDGILQGGLPQDEESAKKDPKSSYASWRAKSAPQPSQPPRPTSLDPDSSTYQPPTPPPSSYQEPPKRPARQEPQPPKKPVRRNKYGDIIEDE